MANLKMKTNDPSKTDTLVLPDNLPVEKTTPSIKKTEHDVGSILSHHMQPATPTPVDPRVGMTPPRDPRQTLRTQPAPTPAPRPNNRDQFLQALDLWKPKPGPEQDLKQDLYTNVAALTLTDIQFEEGKIAQIEAAEFAAPSMAIDFSATDAPTLAKLDDDLRMLQSLKSASIPDALQEAAKKVREEFDACFAAAQEPPHPVPHAKHHSPGADPTAPCPNED